MRPRRGYYAVHIGLTLLFFAAGWAGFVLIGDSWYQLLIAGALAVAFTQVAFLGHDAGHRQIFRQRRPNDAFALLTINLMSGLSFGWWIDKHNRHHAHPNTEGADPDVGNGALAFTPKQAAGRTRPVSRFLTRYQAWFTVPLLFLEGLNLHVAGIRALAHKKVPYQRSRSLEIVLLAAHAGGYLTVLFLVLSPGTALAFVAVQQGLFGLYLGASFAPNHKGMPLLPAGDKTPYLRRQVMTARNVRGGRFTDLLLGGLNYQIEHHLFPSMPRPNLRHAQALVRGHCRANGVPYREDRLFASYAAGLRHLGAVGSAAA